MDRELKPVKSDSVAARMKSGVRAPLVERDQDGVKNVIPSHTFSRNSIVTMKGETGEHSATEQGVYYPPTSCYPYYYSVYNGSYSQLNGQGYLDAGNSSYKSADGSHLYYLPSYNHYPAGTYLSVDGNQPYCSSSGYLQNASAYGSEIMPHYYWNTMQGSDAPHGTSAVCGGAKLSLGSDISANANGSDDRMIRYNFLDSKAPNLARNAMLPQSTASSKLYESQIYDQSLRTLHQLGSSYISSGDVHKLQPIGKSSSYTGGNKSGYFPNVSLNYSRANAGMGGSGNNWSSFSKKAVGGESEGTSDLTHGPRRRSKITPFGSSAENEQMRLSMNKYQFNLEDFKTEYDNAKFYVIKSYNEDNIHKSVKYNVWSSTPDGNKKLDAAFRAKMAKTSQAGEECPIFLFFSVNGSGQFVGVAEMVGPVDFDNNLDFWELNKWNGFFPVKWHIIKDVPNAYLRHIILENNDNKPVTFTRDTQEIGLEQGVEMLQIFKTFAEETSLLEDFNFYEKREQSLEGKRNTAPGNHDSLKLDKDCKRIVDKESGASNDFSDSTSSLINLAKNLSLSK